MCTAKGCCILQQSTSILPLQGPCSLRRRTTQPGRWHALLRMRQQGLTAAQIWRGGLPKLEEMQDTSRINLCGWTSVLHFSLRRAQTLFGPSCCKSMNLQSREPFSKLPKKSELLIHRRGLQIRVTAAQAMSLWLLVSSQPWDITARSVPPLHAFRAMGVHILGLSV